MFKKILIANRGEIACRVIKTAHKLGIKTVAIHSDIDRNSLHVNLADESICIGEAPSNKSYLSIEKILSACNETGADAVHPGYGFLSENCEFAKALENKGISFIGPPAKSIELMGDKITSKKIALGAKVSTVPGFLGLVGDTEEARKRSNEIGYPVMIKASAGGGGKGMRIAQDVEEVSQAFISSQSEAEKSFGDKRVFIEKFISKPRHIEIQVLGDKYGNYVHFGERECSIQRRNQKVIEEAPSPFLKEKTRSEMGKQAILLARAVKYFSAGTVEFIVDDRQKFYFLEMNTRLQVEHPVTELVYGVDIVEEMIRIAGGEKLTIKQSDVKIKGWALESRVYAEDPYRNFLPSTGRITKYRPPENLVSQNHIVRNDTGVYEGGDISIHYDPMIAKLCTWAKNRKDAVLSMRKALDEFEIEGIESNLPFLSLVMDNNKFWEGNFTTAFIEEEYSDGIENLEPSEDLQLKLSAVAACISLLMKYREKLIIYDPIEDKGFFEHRIVIQGKSRFHFEICKSGKEFVVRIKKKDNFVIEIDWVPGKTLINAKINGEELIIKLKINERHLFLAYRGFDIEANVYSVKESEFLKFMKPKAEKDNLNALMCPMPGLLIAINVKAGEKVVSGQVLCTVEAMKMENTLHAKQNGTVKLVNFNEGDILAVDDIIIEFA